MKFSEAWLREYVNPDLSTQALVDQLTMAGLEVDGNGDNRSDLALFYLKDATLELTDASTTGPEGKTKQNGKQSLKLGLQYQGADGTDGEPRAAA